MQVINKRLIDLISLIFLDFGIYLYIIYKIWIIEKYEYNITKTANALKMPRQTLHRKIKIYNVNELKLIKISI